MPSGLSGYHDSQLDELKFYLFSPAPLYPAFEEALLAFSLQDSLDQLGPNDPGLKQCLDGKTPAQAASAVIRGTRLADPPVRKARRGRRSCGERVHRPHRSSGAKVDPFFRENRKMSEENVESVMTAATEKIAKARFAIYGKSVCADATFTLRLAYGKVEDIR